MKLYYLFFTLFLTAFTVYSQDKYPVLTEIVTDKAQIFTQEELVSLREKLTNFEKETTNQVVVLTINSLGESETLENYANKVFNTNKLGQKEKDNGVLLLFSKNDRKVRLEIGYGLEHVLTDALSSRIIRNTMIPEFKKNKPFKGIDIATNQIIDFIKDPSVATQYLKDTEPKTPWFVYVFLAVFIGGFWFGAASFFYINFKQLIDFLSDLLIGKLSLVFFMIMLFGKLVGALFVLPFFVFPIFFVFFTSSKNPVIAYLDQFMEHSYLILAIYLTVITVIASLIALFKVKYQLRKPIKISLLKSSGTYARTISSVGSSSSYSSSSSNYSSSSSSGSSFSGGGGSSGGGGASGSW